MPKVSVVIPTYNRAGWLPAAIESVRQQTFDDLEIIVIDDGSDDETQSLVEALAGAVVYRKLTHSGRPAVARNAGLRIARSEYVAFLDSDDQWLPEKLARQVAVLEANPDMGLVCSNALILDAACPARAYLPSELGASGSVLPDLLAVNFIITSTVLARHDVLEQAGGFCEQPELLAVEDYDLWLRLACLTKIAYIAEPLARYFDQPTTSLRSQRPLSEHWRAMLHVIERVQSVVRQGSTPAAEVGPLISQAVERYQQLLIAALWHEHRPWESAWATVELIRQKPLGSASWSLRSIGQNVRRFGCRLRRRLLSQSSAQPSTADGKLRLHLGCGEVYLPGYVNIDYPPAEHTVQETSRAERFADITRLEYAPGSVHEIRLHHVFEHFERPIALRLLVTWYDWLADGGRLVIETPDFERSILAFLLGTRSQRFRVLRHLFGSQEAGWAIHRDGWYRSKYEWVLTRLGYRDLRFRFASWHGTHNIVVTAHNWPPQLALAERQQAAQDLLRLSLVDCAASEQRLLRVWTDKLGPPGSPRQP